MTERQTIRLFRSMLSMIFLYAGIGHLLKPEKIFGRLSQSTLFSLFPSEEFFMANIYLTGGAMLLAGLALMLGWRTRIASAVLLAILIPITLSVQLEDLTNLGPFFKNVAISGGLIFFIKNKE
jgi:putative oxidoreductase